MPVYAGISVIKTTGTAVPVVNEACAFVSGVDPNKVYRVTSAARRIWDPTVPVIVKDNAVVVAAANYTFDYLAGVVRFAVAAVGPITVDGSYLPTLAIAEIRKYDLKITATLPDVTTFDSAGWRQFVQALKALDLSLEALSSPLVDLDGVAGGVQSLFSWLTSDTPKVVEIARGAEFLRAWYRFENLTDSGEVEGVIALSIGLKGCAQGPTAAFSISS